MGWGQGAAEPPRESRRVICLSQAAIADSRSQWSALAHRAARSRIDLDESGEPAQGTRRREGADRAVELAEGQMAGTLGREVISTRRRKVAEGCESIARGAGCSNGARPDLW